MPMRFMAKPRLVNLLEKTERVAGIMGSTTIVVMVIWTVLDMTWRAIGRGSLGGAIEASELILVLLVFLGLALVQQQGKHIDVPIVTERLPLTAQKAVKVAGLLMSLFVFVILALLGADRFLDAWLGKWRMGFGVYPIPQWPGYLGMAIGSALLSVRLLVDLLKATLPLPQISEIVGGGILLNDEATQKPPHGSVEDGETKAGLGQGSNFHG